MCNISDIYCIIINYAKLIVSVEMNPKPKKLLDRIRDTIQLKQYSNKTEGAYLFWIKQSLLFHDKKHPQDMAATEVEAFFDLPCCRTESGSIHTKSGPQRHFFPLPGSAG